VLSMVIYGPLYDQVFKRYALERLMNAAEILSCTDWSELTIPSFWHKFEMKTQETLNTKHVDIFSDFQQIYVCLALINRAIAVAIARQCEAIFLTSIWKRIEFVKMGEDLAREQNLDNKLKGRRMLCDHPRSDCMQKSERGTLELRSSLMANDYRQGRTGSEKYEGLEDLLRWRMLFGTDGGLGRLVSLSI
jgi:hypothetical protein